MLLMVLTCSSVVISILCEGWSNSTELIRQQQKQQRELDRLKAQQKEANDLHLLEGVMADASDQEIQDLASNYDDAADQARAEVERRRGLGGSALDDSMFQTELKGSGSTMTSSTRDGNNGRAGKGKAGKKPFGVFGELAVLDGLTQTSLKLRNIPRFSRKSRVDASKAALADEGPLTTAIDPVDIRFDDGDGAQRRTTWTSDRQQNSTMQQLTNVITGAITAASELAETAGSCTDDDLLHTINDDARAEAKRLGQLTHMRAKRLGQI